jgi:hypothetical protein
MSAGATRGRARRVFALSASAHAVLFFCAAGARAETTRVHVDYVAARGCPDESAFVADLRARVPQLVLVRDDDALGLQVKVRRRAERFEGRIVVRERGASPSQRTVEGDTCAEVVAAVTLIAALTVDPSARVAPGADSSRDASAADVGTPTTPEPGPAAQVLESAAAPSSDVPGAAQPGEAQGDRAPSSSLLIGAHAAGSSRLTGTVLPSGALFVDLASTRRGLLAPSVRFRVERSARGTSTAIRGAGQFTWTLGSLELCPLAWVAWRLRVSSCARVDAGAVAAEGRDVKPAVSDSRLWLSGGAVLRTRYHIAGALYVELEETVFAPVFRDRFFVAPDVTVFRAAAAGWVVSGGLGVSIW